VKDQELNPRPHTPHPAALPVKVEQWVQQPKLISKTLQMYRLSTTGFLKPTNVQAVDCGVAGAALHEVPGVVHAVPVAHHPGHLQPLAADVQLPGGRRHLPQGVARRVC